MDMTSGKIMPSGVKSEHAHRLSDLADVSTATPPKPGETLVRGPRKWEFGGPFMKPPSETVIEAIGTATELWELQYAIQQWIEEQ